MNKEQFERVTSRYGSLRLAIVGDFCLDRYLEIDPARTEISIETGLEVYNIVNVRSQPGAAGTILNNLVALGIGEIHAVGACGEDGEGWELMRALQAKPGVNLEHFAQSAERRTFTYTKPLVMEQGKAPRELNRLDVKNWSPCPAGLAERIKRSVLALADKVDAFILMDQVDLPETGVVTAKVLDGVRELVQALPAKVIVADSRRGLAGFPPVTFKMNHTELARLLRREATHNLDEIKASAAELARRERHPVFVTMAERGVVGADAHGIVTHVPAFPVRGELDIVGAGDSVTANLTAALAAGAGTGEAMQLAMAAASIVIHQLGTTGTASVSQIRELVQPA